MPKGYIVVCYHSVSDDTALQNYAKLAGPAMQAAGARYLVRGMPVKTYEHGIKQRTIVLEFDSVEKAIAAHDSEGYQAALRVLGDAAVRDVRVVEGAG